jgi:hypothetical protein
MSSPSRVWATDGEIGRVDDVEFDPLTGELDAFWVRPHGLFSDEVRIPPEWIARAHDEAIYLAGSRADIEERLIPASRALARSPTRRRARSIDQPGAVAGGRSGSSQGKARPAR